MSSDSLDAKKFNDSVSDLLKLAKKNSEFSQAEFVTSEHLLLAVLTLEDTKVCSLLNDRDVTLKRIVDEVDTILSFAKAQESGRLVPQSPAEGLENECEEIEVSGVMIGVAPLTRRILDLGFDLAIRNGQTRLMPSDLLLAILLCPDCLANKVLENLRVDTSELISVLEQ